MSRHVDARHDRLLRDYLRAKDHQQPFLMAEVFTPEAVFAPTYAFDHEFGDAGPQAGLAAVTEVFRGMGRQCENIVTLCTEESVRYVEGDLCCRWIVAMSERETGRVRLGWGDYRWQFSEDGQRCIRLDVGMENMLALDTEYLAGIMGWLMTEEGPWCSAHALLAKAPVVPELATIRAYFMPAV